MHCSQISNQPRGRPPKQDNPRTAHNQRYYQNRKRRHMLASTTPDFLIPNGQQEHHGLLPLLPPEQRGADTVDLFATPNNSLSTEVASSTGDLLVEGGEKCLQSEVDERAVSSILWNTQLCTTESGPMPVVSPMVSVASSATRKVGNDDQLMPQVLPPIVVFSRHWLAWM